MIRSTAPSFSGDSCSGEEFPSEESSTRPGGGESGSDVSELRVGGLDECPEEGDRVIASTSVGGLG